MDNASTCCVCGTANIPNTEQELRPYGPGGAPICYACAMSTPEREEQTKKAVGDLFEQAVGVSRAIVLTEDGPKPVLAPGFTKN